MHTRTRTAIDRVIVLSHRQFVREHNGSPSGIQAVSHDSSAMPWIRIKIMTAAIGSVGATVALAKRDNACAWIERRSERSTKV